MFSPHKWGQPSSVGGEKASRINARSDQMELAPPATLYVPRLQFSFPLPSLTTDTFCMTPGGVCTHYSGNSGRLLPRQSRGLKNGGISAKFPVDFALFSSQFFFTVPKNEFHFQVFGQVEGKLVKEVSKIKFTCGQGVTIKFFVHLAC